MSKRVENPEFQGVRMRIVKRVVFVLLLFSTFAMAKTKLILDTDTGFSHPYDKGHMDDASTILMLLKSEQVELLGITEVSGNEWVDQGVQNALKLLEIAGREKVPVFRGALYPLVHDVERFDSIEKYATGYTWRGALNPWPRSRRTSCGRWGSCRPSKPGSRTQSSSCSIPLAGIRVRSPSLPSVH